MTHNYQRILKSNLRQFKTPTTKDAYERGFHRGLSCASWQVLPEVGAKIWLEDEGRIEVTEENQWDVVQSLAYQGESNDRQYSPFEFTASEFNKARNSEARWAAFDQGIADGIAANIGERMAASRAEREGWERTQVGNLPTCAVCDQQHGQDEDCPENAA